MYGGGAMPKYLLEANYTLQGIRGVRSEGASSRVAAARSLIESVGGSLECLYFAFGKTDLYVIADFPDDVSAAAAALEVAASGGLVARTTVLLTADQVDTALAKQPTYRPPNA
jgi:uncharacterized protein with GYD domain